MRGKPLLKSAVAPNGCSVWEKAVSQGAHRGEGGVPKSGKTRLAAPPPDPSDSQCRRGGKLCLGEMLFIMALFHLSAYWDFKHF